MKVEASKFTEVGYVGRDVESMVRDLVELGVDMVREERLEEVRAKAAQNAEDRLLDMLLPPARPVAPDEEPGARAISSSQTRERFREQLRAGRLDARVVEIDVREKSFPSLRDHRRLVGRGGRHQPEGHAAGPLPGARPRSAQVKVPEALEYLTQEEEQKLIDMDSVARAAVERVEQAGIIFIDEIDKIAGREGAHGPDVSREGVQRDILPIVEGTTVNTSYGMVRTDHILFIAAGAFHVVEAVGSDSRAAGALSDPRRARAAGQGRVRPHPHRAAQRPGRAVHGADGDRGHRAAVHRRRDPIASPISRRIVNERTENIGARRLHTVMEKLLDEISFEGPDLDEQDGHDRRGLRRPKMLADIAKNDDLSIDTFL